MAPRRKKKKAQCRLTSDRISSLPQDIIAHILHLMPIRDAIRTSILSSKWRSGWKSMTKLDFNDEMITVPSNCQQLKKYKLATAILHVLLMHTGSILDIIIDVGELDVDSEFDEIISYLSRYHHVEEFYFSGPSDKKHCYKLPSSFYSLQGVEGMTLFNCLFSPPIKFDGFSKLFGVRFVNVDITSEALQRFLSNCPQVSYLNLMGEGSRYSATGNKLTFVELLQCVPSIKFLEIEDPYMKHLSAGGMPDKLPTSLDQLYRLRLGVCYEDEHEVSSALCLIRSSPNLKEICLTGYDKSDTTQISRNFPDIHDYSGFTLDNLEVFCMKYFTNQDREIDFLKLILAKSPMLEQAQIELCESVSVEEENELLRDLLQLRFPRAAPSAKLIFERTEPDS